MIIYDEGCVRWDVVELKWLLRECPLAGDGFEHSCVWINWSIEGGRRCLFHSCELRHVHGNPERYLSAIPISYGQKF
ncbi:hypothetical protein CA13_07880 [Planctomycetes bacterium CA13]|uniref:Uncharacterized protein n=1 Tax=Novipirellula herctigrandis TaxID=2527986 RepID=A0A5C5YWI6_9BACT|nr:hypothetical protein CA13_07880 [Planctomycetes bacterium CA13]